ncbi:DUF1553 domain-containing protein [Akkermansiaceae bacterium]|nr:DUF1553 domain-containing protein [Akkermansiaceae bacterium]MDA7930231.1 DUF1553 domain-containing protein [Akkermansiaceae bacterium]MDA7934279.1 DUF1553 domain-containing protein [Akkermansiaceae bacterium]
MKRKLQALFFSLLAFSGPVAAQKKNDPPVTSHWSFQPVAAKHRHSGVDAYLDEALAEKNLRHLDRGGRRTLIRRLYLVMLGLPPTPEEIRRFLNNDSPRAWEDLVDRVLASPHYGERMARHWLDLTRFAESNGFETNRERPNAWRFRDYVIESFNQDKPYDQFIKEHLAGDALGADIGTGFLVAGPYDIVKSPDPNLTLMQRQDELADMINTTGTAFLGMTIGCARCHDHKFDPISQQDYYSIQAVFAGVKFGERPIKKQVTPDNEKELAALHKSLITARNELEKLKAIAANKEGDIPQRRPPVNARMNTEAFEATTPAKFVRFTIRRTNSSEPCLDELAVFASGGENVALAKSGAIATSSGNLQGYPIHQLAHLNDGKTGNNSSWISNQSGKGWVQIEFAKVSPVERIEWSRDRDGRFVDRVAIDYLIELSLDGITWDLAASSDDRAPFDEKADPNAFLIKLGEQEANQARKLIASIEHTRSRIADLQNGVKAWVANFSKPGATHRLHRGDPMAKREEVPPDALKVIGSLDLATDAPEQARRLALADWIAREENPLTARVAVNRLWQFVFGIGIVDTPSDFGTNGNPPTHPWLLDWLASDFMAHGWSMKHTLRLLLNSEAFQRSSQPNSTAARIDATSRYLWRFPPRRLEAEAIRDGMLAAAGTLDLKMGGPGFHLFEVDRENVVHYHPKEETGPAEWRRMIYLFKIRQEQDAVFGAFDCPDGNQVIPTRNRSTTPLQALNLFNSRFTMQQAEKLAERLKGTQSHVASAFELLYNRPATAEELADSETFIGEHGLVSFCRAMLNTSEFLFIF